jgi:hypothetical protein
VDVAGLRQEAEKELIYLEAFSEHGETNARAAARLIRRLLDRLAAVEREREDVLRQTDRLYHFHELGRKAVVWITGWPDDADGLTLDQALAALAEVCRIAEQRTDEVNALRASKDVLMEQGEAIARERDTAQAEVARLRAALTDARAAWERVQADTESEYDVDLGTLKAWDAMEAALDAIARAGGA